METTLQLNIPLTVSQIAALLRQQLPLKEVGNTRQHQELIHLLRQQLPLKERIRLADLLTAEAIEPTRQDILDDLKRDYQALKQGTLPTRPIQELLDEL